MSCATSAQQRVAI